MIVVDTLVFWWCSRSGHAVVLPLGGSPERPREQRRVSWASASNISGYAWLSGGFVRGHGCMLAAIAVRVLAAPITGSSMGRSRRRSVTQSGAMSPVGSPLLVTPDATLHKWCCGPWRAQIEDSRKCSESARSKRRC